MTRLDVILIVHTFLQLCTFCTLVLMLRALRDGGSESDHGADLIGFQMTPPPDDDDDWEEIPEEFPELPPATYDHHKKRK